MYGNVNVCMHYLLYIYNLNHYPDILATFTQIIMYESIVNIPYG